MNSYNVTMMSYFCIILLLYILLTSADFQLWYYTWKYLPSACSSPSSESIFDLMDSTVIHQLCISSCNIMLHFIYVHHSAASIYSSPSAVFRLLSDLCLHIFLCCLSHYTILISVITIVRLLFNSCTICAFSVVQYYLLYILVHFRVSVLYKFKGTYPIIFL